MLNKRMLFIIFLFISVICVLSSVNADDSANGLITNVSSDEIGIDDGIIEKGNAEEGILTEDDGTFTALQNKINNAGEGDTIYLDKDYHYNDNFGNAEGVKITKSLTINGNGHVIDGLDKSRLIQVNDSYDVVLKDITFKNGHSLSGGAIALANLDSFSVIGCSFENNYADYFAGAIFSARTDTISVEKCCFRENTVDNDGGAIFFQHVGTSSFEGCSFINNIASDCGGCICLDDVGNSPCINCTFENSSAGFGGAIFMIDSDCFTMEFCRFSYLLAKGAGGGIYLSRVINSQIGSSNFVGCNAYDGGAICCLNGILGLKNLNFSNIGSYMFGGAIAANYSDVIINNSYFYICMAEQDTGGAFYNFRGNLTVCNSIFDTCLSWCGGAITSLEGILNVSSSRFLDCFSYYGGSIYSFYGKINVDNSFFNNSHARSRGSVVYTMMSESAIFTNNIFLNSTSNTGSCIDISYTNKEDVIDNGNHFEDVYHVVMGYEGHLNGLYFTCKSNVLTYVLSNDGTFLKSYENIESKNDIYNYTGIDFWGIRNRTKLSMWDENYPDSSIIFGNYNDIFNFRYNITKLFDEDELGDFECTYYIYNEYGTEVEGSGSFLTWNSNNNESNLNLKDKMLSINNHIEIIEDTELKVYPVSLINSSVSQSKSIPSRYDSRDYGFTTSVKNQYDGGNCWAFSGIATLETCIKKATGIEYDFSENNAKNLMAFFSAIGLKLNTNRGGYDSMIMAYLNSWFGPVDDNNDLYDSFSVLSIPRCSLFHVQNIKFLPPRQNSSDNDIYKKAIMDYGAISITINLLGVGHHAITLVGWDDNYEGEDFLGEYTRGAWIFKNSWGADWRDGGYHYLSYYHAFTSDLYNFCYAYTFIFNKNDSYSYNYQYDESGVSDYLYGENHIYYSNKFICENDEERLSAFATYFKTPTEYKVSVYLNNALVLTQSGYSDAGYYTIPFNENINLTRGDEFTIMIENCNDGDNYFPVCQADELNRINYEANNSFFSYDGINWFDLYNLQGYHEFLYGGTKKNTCQVACIKAFTSLHILEITFIDVEKFDNVDLNEEVSIALDSFFGIDGSVVTININGKDYYAHFHNGKAYLNISFDKAGLYTLSAQYKNNVFESNIVEFNFTVNRKNTVISASSVSKVYGGSGNSIITLRDDKGNPISNTVVYFNVAGKTTKILTNAKGQATIPINLVPKSYTATVSFVAGGNYNGATTKVQIVVKKATPKLTAPKKSFNVKKAKKYTITLKDNLGKVIKNAKVTLKIKNKTYKAKTNAKGKATFKLILKKKGKYKSIVKYGGNAYYNAVGRTVTIIVKK